MDCCCIAAAKIKRHCNFSGHDLCSKEPKIEFETNFHNHNGSTKHYMSAYLDESCVQKSYTIDRFLNDNWCYIFEAGDGAVCKQTVNNGIMTS